jgi:hypothetical protein
MLPTESISRRRAGLRGDWPDGSDADCEVLDALAADLRDRLPIAIEVGRYNNGRSVPGINLCRIDRGVWVHLASVAESKADPDVLVVTEPDKICQERIDLRDPQSLEQLDRMLVRAGVPLRGQT